MDGKNYTKKCLKITHPLITLYPYITNKLAVLLSHKETLPWFCSNFIQMWISKSSTKGYWADFLYYGNNRFCPFYTCSLVNKKLIKCKWESIIDFIKDSIDLDFYIYMNINAAFISKYEGYLKNNRRHDIFIYGYDNEKKILNIADFFKNYKYDFSYVHFHDFSKAYDNFNLTNQDDFLKGVYLESYEKTNYKFNIEFVVNSLNDFLDSKNTSIVSDLVELDDKDDIAYGVEVYNVLINYLHKIKNHSLHFADVRPFHMIYEHKVAMITRIKFLHQNGYLNNFNHNKNYYEILQQECLIIRTLIIKYGLTNDINIIDKLIKKLEQVSTIEKEALYALLNSIRLL